MDVFSPNHFPVPQSTPCYPYVDSLRLSEPPTPLQKWIPVELSHQLIAEERRRLVAQQLQWVQNGAYLDGGPLGAQAAQFPPGAHAAQIPTGAPLVNGAYLGGVAHGAPMVPNGAHFPVIPSGAYPPGANGAHAASVVHNGVHYGGPPGAQSAQIPPGAQMVHNGAQMVNSNPPAVSFFVNSARAHSVPMVPNGAQLGGASGAHLPFHLSGAHSVPFPANSNSAHAAHGNLYAYGGQNAYGAHVTPASMVNNNLRQTFGAQPAHALVPQTFGAQQGNIAFGASGAQPSPQAAVGIQPVNTAHIPASSSWLHKKPPHFKGIGDVVDPVDFLAQFETYALHLPVSIDVACRSMMKVLLEAHAALWFKSFEVYTPPGYSYATFASAFRTQFFPQSLQYPFDSDASSYISPVGAHSAPVDNVANCGIPFNPGSNSDAHGAHIDLHAQRAQNTVGVHDRAVTSSESISSGDLLTSTQQELASPEDSPKGVAELSQHPQDGGPLAAVSIGEQSDGKVSSSLAVNEDLQPPLHDQHVSDANQLLSLSPQHTANVPRCETELFPTPQAYFRKEEPSLYLQLSYYQLNQLIKKLNSNPPNDDCEPEKDPEPGDDPVLAQIGSIDVGPGSDLEVNLGLSDLFYEPETCTIINEDHQLALEDCVKDEMLTIGTEASLQHDYTEVRRFAKLADADAGSGFGLLPQVTTTVRAKEPALQKTLFNTRCNILDEPHGPDITLKEDKADDNQTAPCVLRQSDTYVGSRAVRLRKSSDRRSSRATPYMIPPSEPPDKLPLRTFCLADPRLAECRPYIHPSHHPPDSLALSSFSKFLPNVSSRHMTKTWGA
ncbi:uncharacterized protein LOC132201347 [Neocloeon triangulifer]|uniref:uncharacterized protein LOC132201347 n=1 Tax=Neocloeon triangulifer TaxID=2078957 RepID=UPI00286F6381|nr:uncharacterized protein LOC132201347 [Neocloeon triangulifer]